MAINTHGIRVNTTENDRKSFLKDKVSPKIPFQCIPHSNPREYSWRGDNYGKPTARATIQFTQQRDQVLKRTSGYMGFDQEGHRSAKSP